MLNPTWLIIVLNIITENTIVNKRILMMTLHHWIERLPNLRFHHKRIQISTPFIVSHGYFSFLCLNIKTTEVTRVLIASSLPLQISLRPSTGLLIHLCCRDAEMLRKALQEANLMFLMSPHPRWAAWWLVSKLVAKKGQHLQNAVLGGGQVVVGGMGGGGESHGVAPYIQMLQGEWTHLTVAKMWNRC